MTVDVVAGSSILRTHSSRLVGGGNAARSANGSKLVLLPQEKCDGQGQHAAGDHHGAGLADYWEMMMANPRCAGGFLWDLSDQGVVRTDMNNIVDCMGNFGADGIVGPHFEKEGSFYTIKEIWSPVIIELPSEQPAHQLVNSSTFYLSICKGNTF